MKLNCIFICLKPSKSFRVSNGLPFCKVIIFFVLDKMTFVYFCSGSNATSNPWAPLLNVRQLKHLTGKYKACYSLNLTFGNVSD